jgi:hypothetical protein
MIPVKCGCGVQIADYIPPCPEYPHGAFKVIARHFGKKHETVFSIPQPESKSQAEATR